MTGEEYWRFVENVVRRMIEDTGSDPTRWSDLLASSPFLPPPLRKEIYDQLEGAATLDDLIGEGREELWRAVRGHVARHRDYPSTKWPVPAVEMDRLDAIAAKLQPNEGSARASFLFGEHMPHIGSTTRQTDYKAYQEQLEAERRDAVVALYADRAFAGILETASSSVVPWAVGVAAADGLGREVVDPMLGILSGPGEVHRAVSSGFFMRLFEAEGWPWLEELLQKRLDAIVTARLLLSTRDYPRAWEEAAARGDDVSTAFWLDFSIVGLGRGFSHVRRAAEHLLAVGRVARALKLIELYVHEGAVEPDVVRLIAAGLEALCGDGADPESAMLSEYEITELFKVLEKQRDVVGAARVVVLEWSFLPVLGFQPDVPSLSAHLSANPAFFVEVIDSMFVTDPDEDDVDEDDMSARVRRAMNGRRLLASWQPAPGVLADGVVDHEALSQWVTEARAELAANGTLDKGDYYIGQMLLSVPPSDGQSWPAEEIAKLVEDLGSDDVEAGIVDGLFNSRGVTSRGVDEGGTQETELVARWHWTSERYRDQYPRMAAVLRKIAHWYEDEATRQEAAAERFRQGVEW